MIDALVVARTVHFAACTVAVGTVAFAAFALRGEVLKVFERRLRWLTAGALGAAAPSAMAWLVLIASRILDVPASGVFADDGLGTVLRETNFGWVACLRLAFAGLAACALLWRRSFRPALLATTALTATIAFTGHAGAGTGVSGLVHLVSDMVHLIAAGVWLGALPALVWLLLWARNRPEQAAAVTESIRRFSRLATIAVAAIVASGLVNTALLTGLPFDPFSTPYGRALALKLVLLAAVLTLAAVNRLRLTPALPATSTALAVSVLMETALGLAVLLLAGFLGTLAPAGHSMHSSAAAINSGAVLSTAEIIFSSHRLY